MFDTGAHGLPEPTCAVGRAGAPAVQRPLAGRSHVERRRRQPGVVAQAPALRARRRAPGRHGALRRAALPLQLLVPRRCLPPRGAGRGGGPARPGGLGPHRPRRLLRRGALRRGGQGRRGAHGVRGRAHPQRCPLSGRLEARPARRPEARHVRRLEARHPPTPAATTCWCWPTVPRATPTWRGPSAGARWRGRRARPGSPWRAWPRRRAVTGGCSPGAGRAPCPRPWSSTVRRRR